MHTVTLTLLSLFAFVARCVHSDQCLVPSSGWSVSGVGAAGARRPVWRSSGLTLCERFSQKTCCARSQTDRLFLLWRDTFSFSSRCREMFEIGLCMECDPRVGTGQVRHICKRTCEAWFNACQEEFFQAQNLPKDMLEPCMEDSIVCHPLGSFVSNGAELCARFGYSMAEEVCYDGIPDLTAFGEAEFASSSSSNARKRPTTRTEQLVEMLRNIPKPLFAVVAVAALCLMVAAFVAFERMGRDEEETGRRLGGSDARRSRLVETKSE